MAPRWGFVLVGVGVLGCLVACGGETFAPPSATDIQSDLVRAKTAQVSLHSEVHMAVATQLNSSGTGTGVVDFVSVSGDVRQSVQDGSGTDSWSELLYVDGKGFRRSSSTDWQNVNSGDPPLGQISPFSPKSLADQAGTVAQHGRTVGMATVAGVKTHELRVTRSANGGTVTIEAWFEDGGRLRQLSSSVSSPATKFSFVETFLQFGVPVSVPTVPAVQHNPGLPL